MKLKKTSENIQRSYAADGKPTERIESVNFTILDEDGASIGSANIGNGYANVNVNVSGFSTIAEGEQRLASLLGTEMA